MPKLASRGSISFAAIAVLLCVACTTGSSDVGDVDLEDAGADAGATGDDAGADPCTEGVDCPVCAAGSIRCGGEDGQTVEACAEDRLSWETRESCDPSEGTICALSEGCVPLGSSAACTEEPGTEERSYLGCEFYSVTLAHAHLKDDTVFAVAIANPQVSSVWVRVEGGALGSARAHRVEPGELVTVELPYVESLGDMPYDRGTESLLETDAAYRVTSSKPVSVTQFNPLSSIASADATMLLPVTALDDSYRVLTTSAQGSIREHPGNFAVVGVREEATTVRVRPTAGIVAGPDIAAIPAGTERSFELGKGDVLQLVGDDPSSDLSGTTVAADAPVSVFSAHLCANLPGTACDHLEEQTFPTSAWGRRYAVTNFGDSEDVEFAVRIVAGQDGTTVTFDPPTVSDPIALDDGEVTQLITSGQFMVEGSAPILVAELVSGRGEGGEDPSLTYAVPVEQYRPQAIFLTAPEFDQSFVNLIGPRGVTPVLDGDPVEGSSTRIGSSELALWRVPISGGAHTLGTPGDDANDFGVVVYGFRSAGSYAYAAGLNQEELQAPF